MTFHLLSRLGTTFKLLQLAMAPPLISVQQGLIAQDFERGAQIPSRVSSSATPLPLIILEPHLPTTTLILREGSSVPRLSTKVVNKDAVDLFEGHAAHVSTVPPLGLSKWT